MPLARRVPLSFLTPFLALALFGQTNTAAGAGTYPARPEPNSFANLGVRPEVLPWDQGETGLHLLAKKLKNTGRIMHLTAHPDDEDGALLTYLSRGQGRQVLLMSLTRGEGGQNRTGSNLWDELGVLRTLELLESTRYYGTELRFSRVADFGFSKSADETFKKWGGHEVPLRDIVYVIREWKPDVLFTRFSGTPRDGHGHHQASAILAPEAVKCAADPNCFPDQLNGLTGLTTWQVLKLYMGNQGGDYTVRYDVSQVDPDTKLSYTQMALEGFKHQASQLSGTFTPPSGPNWRSYKLVSTTIPNYKAANEQDFFDGIDTKPTGLLDRLKLAPQVAARLKSSLDMTEQALETRDAKKLLIARGLLAEMSSAEVGSLDSDAATHLWQLKKDLTSAANAFLGFRLTASTKSTFVVPGSRIDTDATVANAGTESIQKQSIGLVGSSLRPVRPTRLDYVLSADKKQKVKLPLSAQIRDDAPITRQHWTRQNADRDTVYSVPSGIDATLPILPAAILTNDDYWLAKQGQGPASAGSAAVPVRVSDGKNTNIAIANPVSLLFASTQQVRAVSQKAFDTSVHLRGVVGEGPATITVLAPRGIRIDPASADVNLEPGKMASATFKVTVDPPSSSPQQFLLHSEVSFAGKKYAEGFSTVTRPDLDTFYYYQPAIQRVSIVDVNVPKSLRIGYIPGAGDDIFPVLQQLGLNAKQISNDELAKGDLHQYDTIVVGIRGYDERPEIRANNQRLLDFLNAGGTLIVQNQKAEDVFNSGKFTPYPATLGRQRVSVEEAPVDVLAPNDPIFNAPNKITQADFDGWVQERGINFMSDWDAKFEPLLASNDPGEQPLKGGLLRAKYGKGTYIYTGYAFFRQLPAGVPGAVRLYVNLLTAGHDGK